MMKKLLLLCLLVGCSNASAEPHNNFRVVEGNGGDYVYHDDKRQTTCWSIRGSYELSISCIPDWQLKPPATSVPK